MSRAGGRSSGASTRATSSSSSSFPSFSKAGNQSPSGKSFVPSKLGDVAESGKPTNVGQTQNTPISPDFPDTPETLSELSDYIANMSESDQLDWISEQVLQLKTREERIKFLTGAKQLFPDPPPAVAMEEGKSSSKTLAELGAKWESKHGAFDEANVEDFLSKFESTLQAGLPKSDPKVVQSLREWRSKQSEFEDEAITGNDAEALSSEIEAIPHSPSVVKVKKAPWGVGEPSPVATTTNPNSRKIKKSSKKRDEISMDIEENR